MPKASTPEPDRDESLHESPYDARADAAADAALLRALAQTRGFHLGTPQHATLARDGKTVLFLRSAARDPKQSLFEMDVATGAVRELVTPDSLLAGPETLSPEERVRRERMRVRTTGFTSLDASDDGARALLTLSGRAFVLDRSTGKTQELLAGEGAVVDARLSPDAARVAYVKDDDVHVIAVAAGSRPARVTQGGSEKVTHGLADFVAAEELDRTRGFWWSPDGARILFEEADSSRVDQLWIADPSRPDQSPQRIAYPRAGRANAEVRFGIAPATGGGKTTWVEWDRARFPYVAHASWPKGGPPLLYVLDRLQRAAQLLAVDAASGKTMTLVDERDAAWINVDPSVPRWLAESNQFLWTSERSGEWQIELRDTSGRVLRELLPKGFGYVSVAGVDEKKRTAVVVASADPTAARAWIVSLDASAPPRAISGENQNAFVSFGESRDAYVSWESAADAWPRVFVRSIDGATAREIPSAGEVPPSVPNVEFASVGADQVRVAIQRPRGFRAGRKYAVIDAAYGGPHANVVQRSALAYVRQQWMADVTGSIVVSIDARGTPRRGREWERAIAKKLGAVPLEGHVAALQACAAKYPEMDLARVGVYGWSFGGYFAALAVLARPDVYKVGVAGAPVVDWRDYDTAYTERYLGLPADDAAAYDSASLLGYARKPASEGTARPLLVVHGTGDDNVWFVHTLKLADAMTRARRPFELMPLSGSTHMLLDADLSESVWMRTAEVLRDGLREP